MLEYRIYKGILRLLCSTKYERNRLKTTLSAYPVFRCSRVYVACLFDFRSKVFTTTARFGTKTGKHWIIRAIPPLKAVYEVRIAKDWLNRVIRLGW